MKHPENFRFHPDYAHRIEGGKLNDNLARGTDIEARAVRIEAHAARIEAYAIEHDLGAWVNGEWKWQNDVDSNERNGVSNDFI